MKADPRIYTPFDLVLTTVYPATATNYKNRWKKFKSLEDIIFNSDLGKLWIMG